jgi:hypothetical protein
MRRSAMTIPPESPHHLKKSLNDEDEKPYLEAIRAQILSTKFCAHHTALAALPCLDADF